MLAILDMWLYSLVKIHISRFDEIPEKYRVTMVGEEARPLSNR